MCFNIRVLFWGGGEGAGGGGGPCSKDYKCFRRGYIAVICGYVGVWRSVWGLGLKKKRLFCGSQWTALYFGMYIAVPLSLGITK